MALDWKNKVIQNFERAAFQYDQYAHIQKKIAEDLSKDFPKDSLDILEVGCGTGILTELIAQKYHDRNLHITDISDAMLKHALCRTKHPNVIGSILDAEQEKTGRTYDLIVGNMVCHWFKDIKKGIRNLSSMLNKNGNLFLTMPSSQNFCEWRNILHKLSLPCGILNFGEPQDIYRQQKFFQPVASAGDFLRSIKNTGSSLSLENYKNLSTTELRRACKEFDKRKNGFMTWDILFIRITKKDL